MLSFCDCLKHLSNHFSNLIPIQITSRICLLTAKFIVAVFANLALANAEPKNAKFWLAMTVTLLAPAFQIVLVPLHGSPLVAGSLALAMYLFAKELK